MIASSSDLRYFLELAETLNVSRASERLGISQPTLSMSLQRLEKTIGAPLFLRSRTGVELTRAGKKLREKGRHLSIEWEDLRSQVLREEEEPQGRYIIGCHPSVALYTLPFFLPELLQQYPLLDIKLSHDLSRRITEKVISFEIDFGLVVNPWAHPDLVIKPFRKDIVTIFTRANDLQTVPDPKEIAVLIADPDLLQAQSILKELEKFEIQVKRFLPSSNLEVIAELVASGAGMGILPTCVANQHGGLIPLKKAPVFKDTVALIYRADAQASASSRKLARFIDQALKKSDSK